MNDFTTDELRTLVEALRHEIDYQCKQAGIMAMLSQEKGLEWQITAVKRNGALYKKISDEIKERVNDEHK